MEEELRFERKLKYEGRNSGKHADKRGNVVMSKRETAEVEQATGEWNDGELFSRDLST